MAALAGVICVFLGRPAPPAAPSEVEVDEAKGVEEMLDGEIAINVHHATTPPENELE
jgi:hypothetical protein